ASATATGSPTGSTARSSMSARGPAIRRARSSFSRRGPRYSSGGLTSRRSSPESCRGRLLLDVEGHWTHVGLDLHLERSSGQFLVRGRDAGELGNLLWPFRIIGAVVAAADEDRAEHVEVGDDHPVMPDDRPRFAPLATDERKIAVLVGGA